MVLIGVEWVLTCIVQIKQFVGSYQQLTSSAGSAVLHPVPIQPPFILHSASEC